MKVLHTVVYAVLVCCMGRAYGVQVIGGRLDLNQLAVTAGQEQKYGTYMIDITPALTAYDLKVALAKRMHISARRLDIVIARQTLEDTDRIQEVIGEVTDNKIHLRIDHHPKPLTTPLDKERYANRWNQL
jgi:hypothetical protein